MALTLPVVFLTSHPELVNEELAFERGALDFVDKTRGVEILARRLRLVAKSGKPAATPEAETPIVRGKLVLSPSASRAYWNDVDVGLTVSEYDIVQCWRAKSVAFGNRALHDRLSAQLVAERLLRYPLKIFVTCSIGNSRFPVVRCLVFLAC
jgi:two-component system response regulator ChvI